MSPGRTGFAVFCILGMVAILVAAGFEIARFRRGDGIVGRRQFRLRMVSASVWLLVLLTNLYAVTALWPPRGRTPEAKEAARHFLSVMGWGFSLLLVALVLLMIDLWQTARERRLQEARFQAELVGRAREEAARLKQSNRTSRV